MSERDLWVAVITTAILDLQQIQTIGRKNERDLYRTHEEHWIGTADFKRVCIMAGFEPDYIEAKAKEVQDRALCKALEASLAFERDRYKELLMEDGGVEDTD